MPGTLYLVLDREISTVEIPAGWRTLGYAEKRLSGLCQGLGVQELSRFVVDIPEELADDLEDDLDLLGEVPLTSDAIGAERWFPPADGLATVRALVGRVEAEPGLVREPQQVIADLRELADILVEAAAHDVSFHLAVEADRRRTGSRGERRRSGRRDEEE